MEIKDVLPVSPYVKVTPIRTSQQLLPSYSVTMSDKYKLVRVPYKLQLPNSQRSVAYSQMGRFELSNDDLINYKYYVIGDNIRPTALSEFISSVTSDEKDKGGYGIENICQTGEVVTITYFLPESNSHEKIILRNILNNSALTVRCDSDQNKLSMDISSLSKGVYVVEILSDNIILDTKKFVIK